MSESRRKSGVLRTLLFSCAGLLLTGVPLLAPCSSAAPMGYTPVASWAGTPQGAPRPIALQRDATSGLLLVRALIDGKACTLIVDTGTTHTSFDTQFIRRNFPGVPLQPVTLRPGSNVSTPPQAIAIKNFQLGDSIQRSFFGIVMDMSTLRTALGVPVDGILGMNNLGIEPFLLSASQGILQWLPSKLPLPPGFQLLASRINSLGGFTLGVQAGKRELFFLIDSGATYTSVPASSWPAGTVVLQGVESADINSRASRTEQVRRGLPLDIRLTDDFTLPSVEPILTENDIPCILGLDMLRRFDMLIDVRRGELRIRPLPHTPQDHHP